MRFDSLNPATLIKFTAHCRGGSIKTNSIVLSDDEIRQVLLARL
jgi:alcohol dehydrogenase